MEQNENLQSFRPRSIERAIFGTVLASASCLYLAHIQGVAPKLSTSANIAIFPGAGIFWGLLISWLSQADLEFLTNQLRKDRPKSSISSFLDASTQHAATGSLYFSLIGAIAFTIALFINLDKRDLIERYLFQVSGTLFLGLIIFAFLKTLTIKYQVASSSAAQQQDVVVVSDADLWWYLTFSVCITVCIGLVFFILKT